MFCGDSLAQLRSVAEMDSATVRLLKGQAGLHSRSSPLPNAPEEGLSTEPELFKLTLPAISATPRGTSTLDAAASSLATKLRAGGAQTERVSAKWRRAHAPVLVRLRKESSRPLAVNAVEALEKRGQALLVREKIRQVRRRSDWPPLEQQLTQALEIQPNNEQLLCERSVARLRQRKITDSIADAKHVLEVNPFSAKGYSQVALGMMFQQRYSEAAEQLVQSLECDPTHEPSAELLGEVLSTIRRTRSYWKPRPEKPNPTFDKVLENRTEFRPADATRPCPPAPAKVQAESHSTIRVAWEVVNDDGGDECFQYELQYTPVDPITAEVSHWRTAYRGIRKFGVLLADLLSDTEYCFRVQASNTVGESLWSGYSRARTAPVPEGYRKAINEIPESWNSLKDDLEDAYRKLYKGPAQGAADELPIDLLWDDLRVELQNSVSVLKQCFRVYTLAGAIDDEPVNVSMLQFRKCLTDLKLIGKEYPQSDMDMIFLRSCQHKISPKSSPTKSGTFPPPKSNSHPPDRVSPLPSMDLANEVRRSLSPPPMLALPSKGAPSVTFAADSKNAMSPAETSLSPSTASPSPPPPMRPPSRPPSRPAWSREGPRDGLWTASVETVPSLATPSLSPLESTRVSIAAQGDALAALESNSDEKKLSQAKFVGAMVRLAAFRAAALKTDAASCGSLGLALAEFVHQQVIPHCDLSLGDAMGATLKDRKVQWVLEKWRDRLAFPYTVYSIIDDEGSMLLMNLTEMLALFRDSGFIDDELCTRRDITNFFAIVNLDDELFEAAGGKHTTDNSLELTLDEFLEVAARVCDAKLRAHPELTSQMGSPPLLGLRWTEVGTTPRNGKRLQHSRLEEALSSALVVPKDLFETFGLEQDGPHPVLPDSFVQVGKRYFKPEEPGFEHPLELWIETLFYPATMAAAKKKVDEESAASPEKKRRMAKRLKSMKKTFDAEIVEDGEAIRTNPNSRTTFGRTSPTL